ncbi:hypothetical protein QSJ19_19710 [Gordonia sp. ABSL11-1]|uniref:hypothetical protein n=1 Tax=Gordonia sp. ABSL11-1 TaxID=3053924 RepID=UPI00257455C6|nr:hypothetical protein [Gordonia sp. ABSL11-1]MDL9947764.1 hypothetical protein [Gordonia sp. ABSL11-1]
MSTQAMADPRSRSMAGWRSRLGVLASRGETSGPRVDEARAALSWWRLRAAVNREVASGLVDQDQADAVLDSLIGEVTMST